MINPYEATALAAGDQRSVWHYGLIVLAGLMGYGCPMVALGLVAWLNHGWPVAWENIERVFRLHRELSLNSVAGLVPNVVLAFLVGTAVSKRVHHAASCRRYWMLAFMTLIGYVLVLYSTGRWNLIPSTWPAEIHNALRSALTLLFPMTAWLIAELRKRRTELGH